MVEPDEEEGLPLPALPAAGVGPRALAALLDALLVFLAWITALLLYSISGDLLTDVKALSFAGQLLAVAGVLAAGWGWDVAWEVLARGQTPGKRALGLRVVRVDGAPVGPLESVVRNALRALELPLAYAPAVLLVALGARRQRLGDLVAGTVVVQERRYDLSRYGPPAGAAERLSASRGRLAGLLGAADFERLVDYLARRPELDPGARGRLATSLAGVLAARAGLAPPASEEAEGFLEALAALAAEPR